MTDGKKEAMGLLFDKFHEYVEELLLAQYRVSQMVEHLSIFSSC